MGKSILVMGHAYIVGANREVWSKLGQKEDVNVDLIVPRFWKSNLVGDIEFKENEIDKKGIRTSFPIDVYFKGNGSFYFHRILKLWSILLRNRYDLVIINQEGWSLSLLIFNILCFFSRNKSTRKFLMVAQNIKKDHLRWAIPLEKFNMKFVRLVLGCCSETEDVLRWKKIVTPWKFFPLFYNSSLEVKEIRENSSASLKLGYIGRLSFEKGIDTLLDSYKTLSDCELIIAGDGPLREKVEESSANYLGLLAHDQVKKFYEQIDVLIVPSVSMDFWKEQFGRVIAEAVAHGVAVVGSDSGAIPEVLGELNLDYIFKEGDSKSLNLQIDRVRKDIINKKMKDKIEAAQILCREKFSEDAFIKRLLKYEQEC